MAKKEKGVLHKAFEKARGSSPKLEKNNTARDLFDFMIVTVANERLDGAGVNDTIEDVRIGIWLERAWYGLENNNLLL